MWINGGMNMGLIKLVNKTKDYGKLVMFSHTIFSFSFALISMVLAANGLPSFWNLFWIIVCFMGARTGANALNRVIDAEIDARNPRTANRQIPKGEIKRGEVLRFTTVCFLFMFIGAYQLNWLSFTLAPIALFLMVIYPYCKRFTFLCHVVLGLASACAPVGAWIAITGELSIIPVLLGIANTLWVAGFDVIYGSQDYDFDTANGIHSIPSKFGVKNALYIAMTFHIITVICLIAIGLLAPQLNFIFYIGIIIIAGLFVVEYRMISPSNLTNANIASYNVNQLVSIVFLTTGLLGALI